MKKIKFIRHGKLIDPFSDYTKLTFGQVCDLATERLNPSIDEENRESVPKKLGKHNLDSLSMIMCSLSNRTMETAEMIRRASGKEIAIMRSDYLSEILFNPAKFMTKGDYSKSGLVGVQRALYPAMENGNGAELLSEVFQRIARLEKLLKAETSENILCVTHGFFLRMLHQYFVVGVRCDSLKERPIPKIIRFDHLEGFDIYL